MNHALRAAVAVLSSALAGCWMIASATNVVVEGRVVTEEGAAVEGATLYYVDMKYRPLMMPGVGEHGQTTTDVTGSFRAEFDRAHSAIGITLEHPKCYSAGASIEREAWKESAVVRQDLVCALR